MESITPSRDTALDVGGERCPRSGRLGATGWGESGGDRLERGLHRDTLGRTYSPEIELKTLEIPLGLDISDSYYGLDGLVEYLRAWLEPFTEYHVENLDYIEAGECVLIPSRQWGVGRESGIRTELELTTLCELRDGRIVRVQQYDTLEDAREAAGLSE